jgi:hypothetical protein
MGLFDCVCACIDFIVCWRIGVQGCQCRNRTCIYPYRDRSRESSPKSVVRSVCEVWDYRNVSNHFCLLHLMHLYLVTILLPDLVANATNHSSPAIGYNATVCWSYAMQAPLASFNQSSLNATAEHLKLILSAFQSHVDHAGGAPQKLLSKIFGW